jgi:MoxR-like ATPase
MLPESQLDRFMVKLSMGYPTVEQEIAMLKQRQGQNPLDEVKNLISAEILEEMQIQVQKVFVNDAMLAYVAQLVEATRKEERLRIGVSPRGTLSILAMAKAAAFMEGRDFLIPEDVECVFVDTTAHRVLLSEKAKMAHKQETEILREILASVAKPQWKR